MPNLVFRFLVCPSLAFACLACVVIGCKRSAPDVPAVLPLPEGWRWGEPAFEPALVAYGPEVEKEVEVGDGVETRVLQPNLVVQERFWMGKLEAFQQASLTVVTNRTEADYGEWKPMTVEGFDAIWGQMPNTHVTDGVEIAHDVYLLQVPMSHVYIVTHTFPKVEGQPDPAIKEAVREFKALEFGELLPKKESER